MDKQFNLTAHSPAAHLESIHTDSFQLSELPLHGKIILRGKSDDTDFLNAAEKNLSVALPLDANTTVATDDGCIILWLGPSEWMIWTPTIAQAETLLPKLKKDVEPLHAACIDVTDYYTILKISGKQATSVLAYGCPLDLREKSFASTRCAQSIFRHANILIYKVDSQEYKIQIRWSFTEYLWNFFSTVSSSSTNSANSASD